MRFEPYEFPGHSGQMLAGRLELPAGDPAAYALFAHCFTCTKDFAASRAVARALAARGVATLRFDFTGLGGSEGEFANTGFTSNVEDLILAARALAHSHRAPSLLIGHSLGGAAVLAAARELESVRAVATIGAPFDPAHVLNLFEAELETVRGEGEATVEIEGRRFPISRKFVDDISAHNQQAAIAGLGRALLVMHAPTDQVVGVENARLIYDAARHPKSFISLDGADHLLSRVQDADYVAEVLTAWAARYLDAPEQAAPAGGERGTVTVAPAPAAGFFAMDMRAGPHAVRADEPEDMGGEDTGPSPYDLLLMAVGSCTAMTLKMYARRKKLDLQDVRVTLSQERLHGEDCADCEEGETLHRIRRTIRLAGALSEAERERLMEIADKCPVHRTLEGRVQIVSELDAD